MALRARKRGPQLRPSDLYGSGGFRAQERSGGFSLDILRRPRLTRRRLSTTIALAAVAGAGVTGFQQRDWLAMQCLKVESVSGLCSSEFVRSKVLSPPGELLPSAQFKVKRVIPATKNEKGETVPAKVYETSETVQKLGIYSIDPALITKDTKSGNIWVKANFQYYPAGYREAYTEYKDVPGFTQPITTQEILGQDLISFVAFMASKDIAQKNPAFAKTLQESCVNDMAMLAGAAITHSGYLTQSNPYGVKNTDLARAENGYELGAYAAFLGKEKANDPSVPDVYVYGQTTVDGAQKSVLITCGVQ